MTDHEKRGKVIDSLAETREFIAATKNMFKIGFPDIVSDVFDNALCAISDAITLLEEQKPIEVRLHLCESCAKEYPECDANADGIKFGCGIGNDNVIGCTAYVNRWKAQEPRVMTLEEVANLHAEPVWFENRSNKTNDCGWIIVYEYHAKFDCIEVRGAAQLCMYSGATYLKFWRCWTSRPTEEQREAVDWE